MIGFYVICDVCGAEGVSKKPGDIGFHPTISLRLTAQDEKQLDLCQSCGQELAYWIQSGGLRKNDRKAINKSPVF